MLTPQQKADRAKEKDKARPARKKAQAKKDKAKKSADNLKPTVDLNGPRPMSKFDYEFCQAFVQCGKQEPAYRQLRPDVKYPGEAARAMMMRDEIRDHIKAILKELSQYREKAAIITARSSALTLEVADDRLMEILETRRRTRGEMLTRDIKQLLVEGATPVLDENGKVVDYVLSLDLKASLLNESSPIEDADLLKAIKLTFERKQGIIKAEKPAEVTFLGTMLYRPKWFHSEPRIIESHT
jgi:hypothetical protein